MVGLLWLSRERWVIRTALDVVAAPDPTNGEYTVSVARIQEGIGDRPDA
jgi:hypothetical protein